MTAVLTGRTPQSADRPLGMVVTDLDRTLTDTRLRVVPSALREIDRVRSLGTPTVLATGRREGEVRQRGLHGRFDYFILEGGALVGPPDALALQPGAQRVAEMADWLAGHRIPFRKGHASLSVPVEHEPETAIAAKKRGLEVNRNFDRLDITGSGVSKGAAVKQLRRRMKRDGVTLAIGDGENDLGLFAASQYCVAVANAHPRLVAVADEVTEKPGGVGVGLFLAQRVVAA